jgi:hypothetical protein
MVCWHTTHFIAYVATTNPILLPKFVIVFLFTCWGGAAAAVRIEGAQKMG